MRTEYKRDMNHNYLILHGDNEIDTASYQVRMLVGNVIPSLLKCRIQGMDGKFMVYYDITSRQSLSTFYEDKKLRREEVKLIFNAFVRVMEDTAEYLMNPGQLVISPDLIFLEADKKELYFCLMPGYQKDIKEQLQILAEYILPKIDHEDEEAVRLGYGIYRRALEDSFQLEHIKEELYRGWSEDKSSIVGKPTGFGEAEGENRFGHGTDPDQEDNALWNDGEEGLGFMRKGTENSDNSNSVGNKVGKAILTGFLFLVAAGGIIAAKIMGYLPQIGMEVIMGTVIMGIGVGMLIYLGVKNIKERKEQREYDDNLKQRDNSKQDKKNRKMSGRIESVSKKEGDRRKENGSRKECGWNSNYYESNNAKETDYRKIKNDKEEDGNKTDITGRNKSCKNKELQRRGFKQMVSGEEISEKGDFFGETVILSAAEVAGPASLVSHEPGELAPIYLQEDITVIGKLENACDAVIELPTVSRIHAKIRKRDNEYYLTDLNSRNGTSVNGRLLRPDEEYKLENEDKVDFAQARYIFISRQ